MTLIVHGRATSSNVQAVMWGAAEMGLSPERRDVGGRFGGTDTAAFRAMNPFGLVPVLEDGDTAIFESAAILRHLARAHAGGALIGDPRAEGWAEWAKNTLCRSFTVPVFWSFWRTPESKRDMDLVTRNLRAFEENAAFAMAARGAAPWITGDGMTLADIWAGHILFRYFTLDLPHRPPAGLEDWYAALTERPAYREHVMVDYSELKAREDA